MDQYSDPIHSSILHASWIIDPTYVVRATSTEYSCTIIITGKYSSQIPTKKSTIAIIFEGIIHFSISFISLISLFSMIVWDTLHYHCVIQLNKGHKCE